VSMLLGYILLINIAHNAINAIQPAFFAELFGPRVRYSGIAMGTQLGAIVAGGLTPFIASGLSRLMDNHWQLVAAYISLTALVTAYAAWRAPETAARDLLQESD
ncbi:MAG: MFS transporter, partial [Enterobacteriaceae bacterium]